MNQVPFIRMIYTAESGHWIDEPIKVSIAYFTVVYLQVNTLVGRRVAVSVVTQNVSH